MKKRIITFIVVLGVAVFLPSAVFAKGQLKPPTVVSEVSKTTIIDIIGRKVTVSAPVKKIAFFHPGTADALLILDSWDMVVGKTGYKLDKDIFPGLDKITTITPPIPWAYTDTETETLLGVAPDLLILEKSPIPGLDKLLADLDGVIPVVIVGTGNYNTMNESFEILGKLLNRESEAEKFLNWSNGIVQNIAGRLKNLKAKEKTKVFYKFSFDTVENISTGNNQLSSIAAINRIAAGINIAGKIESQGGYISAVDREWLIAQDYDVLIIRDNVPGGFGHVISDPALVKKHRERVMALPAFEHSKAVKNNRVYMIIDFFIASPLSAVGFTYFAKAFHPELFTDMNPEVFLQEYYSRFLNTNINVADGVFFYPRL